MSERPDFTVKSKVKEHLRQSLEDKCSKIGGWQIFFGLNDSMLRMLTPVQEVVTPVPGTLSPNVTPELLFSGNTVTWTLSNPEDCPESLSEQDITDVQRHRSRRVLQPDVGSHIDSNTGHNGAVTQPKSVSTTKPKRSKKKYGLSNGQKSDSADTVVSDGNKESSHLSGGSDGHLDDHLYKETKVGKQNRKQSVSVQRLVRNGHRVTEIELPTIQLPRRKDLYDQKQDKSYRKGNCSGSSVNYTNISVKCTLPPLEERSPNIPKKAAKTKSNGTNEIHVRPPIQQTQKALKGQTRTSSVALPPIKSISGRDRCVQRGSAREVPSARSLRLQDTHEGRISRTKQDSIRLPSINTNKLPGTERAKTRRE